MIMKIKTLQKMSPFSIKKSQFVDELQCQVTEVIHDKSGAKITHIGNNDTENAFCLSFQTMPKDSSGVAHILEHAILCGSKKFPVRDPFFSMMRRSLNTFMNAWTGPDFTSYPAASQVKKDFYNLLEVYIDAVFHPLLTKESFLQEGHRLEFQNLEDLNTPLCFKGIVFNEMKGAMASPDARLHEHLNQALFPTLTYGVNSGGDPKEIVNLKYEDFVDFHKTYYHPSRCHFYFYGDIPLEEHLEFIDKHLLHNTEKLSPLPRMPRERRFEKPIKKSVQFPLPKSETQENPCYFTVGYLTCPIDNQEDVFALNILEILLMGSDAAPLKSRLLKSPLCQQASMYCQDEYSEVPLILSLKGCPNESQDALDDLVNKSLYEVIERGFTEQEINNAFHQFAFHRSEISHDSYPFGLILFMRAILPSQHGIDPEKGVLIKAILDNLRKILENNPHFFTDLIKKYMINNYHKVSLFMEPSETLSQEEEETEKKLLEKISASLSLEQKQDLVKQAQHLQSLQSDYDEKSLECLPKVTLSDVPKNTKDFALHTSTKGPFSLYTHACFTNHIHYADLYFTLPQLTVKEIEYLPLLAHFLPQVGWNGRDYKENLRLLQENTGGMGAAISYHQDANLPAHFTPFIALHGKAMDSKVEEHFKLLREMAETASFQDTKRIKALIKKLHTSLKSRIVNNAMRYATSLGSSYINKQLFLQNHLGGLPFFEWIEQLSQLDEADLSKEMEILTALQKKIFSQSHVDLIINADQPTLDRINENHYFGLMQIPVKKEQLFKFDQEPSEILSQGRIISSPVAFTSQSIKVCGYEREEEAAALSIAAPLLNSVSLHGAIREQGGAYGGGASYNPLTGIFRFYGYRDPHIVRTLKAFKESVQHICKGKFSDQQLEEAKLEKIQDFDDPTSPGDRAQSAYHWNKENLSLEKRQSFRETLMKVSKSDVTHALEKYLLNTLDIVPFVTFGSKELLEREKKKMVRPFEIEPLLSHNQ